LLGAQRKTPRGGEGRGGKGLEKTLEENLENVWPHEVFTALCEKPKRGRVMQKGKYQTFLSRRE